MIRAQHGNDKAAYLEEDEDEEELVDDADAQPEPPVSYKDTERAVGVGPCLHPPPPANPAVSKAFQGPARLFPSARGSHGRSFFPNEFHLVRSSPVF